MSTPTDATTTRASVTAGAVATPRSPRPRGLAPELAAILDLLDEARQRTFALVAPVRDDDWFACHDPVMGPIAWDVVHMGNQEELWCVRALTGAGELREGYEDIYHAYRNPRPRRASLPLLSRAEALEYRQEVADRVAKMAAAGPSNEADPLWVDLFAHKMIVLHEHQHGETILQALRGFPSGTYAPPDLRDSSALSWSSDPSPQGDPKGVGGDNLRVAPSSSTRWGDPASKSRTRADGRLNSENEPGWVLHEGATFPLGTHRQAWTYDNEWPSHDVRVAPFLLQRHPVTNGDWLRFVEAGGYEDVSLWDPEGHSKLMERGWRAPAYWAPRPEGWYLRMWHGLVPLPLDHPVCHITWYEADAFARWSGARLPSEVEWEYAATWDPETGTKRKWPWGDGPWRPEVANLDQWRFDTAPVGSHPEGRSPWGVEGLIGDVWEWTKTVFAGYPGYEAFPYDEYSGCFLDRGLRVLRGGAWATRPALRLGTFRNWDLPVRRQIFAGLRLAADDVDGRPELDQGDTPAHGSSL